MEIKISPDPIERERRLAALELYLPELRKAMDEFQHEIGLLLAYDQAIETTGVPDKAPRAKRKRKQAASTSESPRATSISLRGRSHLQMVR